MSEGWKNLWLQRPLPSIFNEGIIVSGMCLTAVDDNSHEFIVLRDSDFLPGWPSWGALASPLAALSAAVLTSHSSDGVRLHVQHPGELCKNNKEVIYITFIFVGFELSNQCILVIGDLGLEILCTRICSSYLMERPLSQSKPKRMRWIQRTLGRDLIHVLFTVVLCAGDHIVNTHDTSVVE